VRIIFDLRQQGQGVNFALAFSLAGQVWLDSRESKDSSFFLVIFFSKIRLYILGKSILTLRRTVCRRRIMSASGVSSASATPADELEQERRKRRYSQLARAYNEGYEEGGQGEAICRLREKLKELFAHSLDLDSNSRGQDL